MNSIPDQNGVTQEISSSVGALETLTQPPIQPSFFANSTGTQPDSPSKPFRTISNGVGTSQSSSSPNGERTISVEDQAMYALPPAIPVGFSRDQERQYVTVYRLKSLDTGLKRHIMSAPSFSGNSDIMRFYRDRRQDILDTEDIAATIPETSEATVNSHIGDLNSQEKSLQGGSSVANGDGVNHPSFGFPASANKRKADEEIGRDRGSEGSADTSKKARGDSMTYPSLPSQGSHTSNLFASIANGTKSNSKQPVETQAPQAHLEAVKQATTLPSHIQVLQCPSPHRRLPPLPLTLRLRPTKPLLHLSRLPVHSVSSRRLGYQQIQYVQPLPHLV